MIVSDRIRRLPSVAWFLLLLGLIWGIRLLQVKSSFPGFSSDYAAHLVLAYELFLNPAAFLSWPPPYWGIVLSHVLTWPFLALGMDVSRAMLLVLDMSVLVTVFSLICAVRSLHLHRSERLLFIGLIFAATIPGMMSMAAHGFYSQVVSWTFYVPLLVLLLTQGLKSFKDLLVSALLLGLGVLCYPDAFLWLAPLWILSAWSIREKRRLILVCALVVAAAWFVLLRGQVKQMWMDGGGGRGFEFSLATIVVLAGLILRHRMEPNTFQGRLRFAFLVYAGVAGGLCLYSFFSYGEVLYYARKNIYAVYYMLPLVALYGFSVLSARIPTRGYLLAGFFFFAMGLPQILRGSFSEMYDYLLRARGPISLEDRIYVRAQRSVSSCLPGQRLVLVPHESSRSAHNQLGPRIPRLVYANLGAGLIDVSNSTLTWSEGTQGYIAAAQTWAERGPAISGSKMCLKSD
jgi:hypothetical protein